MKRVAIITVSYTHLRNGNCTFQLQYAGHTDYSQKSGNRNNWF